MELSEIWMWYCEERLNNPPKMPPLNSVDPWTALDLFFDLHPMFTARYDVINSVAYDTANDNEADGALSHMARFDTFDGWDRLSAGGWRVISERLLWSETVIGANIVEGTKSIAQLPQGLDRQSQSRALMLMYLLGGSRTIDPQMLRERPDGRFPAFPSAKPIRKH